MKFLIYVLSLVLLVNFVCLKGEEQANKGLETRDIVTICGIIVTPMLIIVYMFISAQNQMKHLKHDVASLHASVTALGIINNGGSSSKDDEGTESPNTQKRNSLNKLDEIQAAIDKLSQDIPKVITEAIARSRVIPEYPGNGLNGQPINPPIKIATVKDNSGRK